MRDPLVWLAAIKILALLGPAAAACAWLLRCARAPGGAVGAAMLAGALVGALLGATTLARIAPNLHRGVYSGDAQQRAALAELQSRHETERAALAAAGGDAATIESLRERHEEAEAPQRAAAARVRSARAQGRNAVVVIAFALVILLGPWWSVGPPRPSRTSPLRAAAIGLCSLIVAGGAAALLARWTLNAPWVTAIPFGASIGAGSAFFGARARRVDRRVALSAEIDIAGGAAFVGGFLALGALGVTRAWVAGIALSLWMTILAVKSRRNRRFSRNVRHLVNGVVVPILVAAAVAHVDFAAEVSRREFWIAAVIAVIFSSDGRWLGAWLGWWVFGGAGLRGEAWRRAAAMVNALIGPIQVGFAAMAAANGVFSTSILGAVVAGAVVLEVTAGARGWAARLLDGGAPFAGN